MSNYYMVYVLNIKGQPLMPTNRYGKVRHLLKNGKAKVVNRCPFTIQLNYETKNYTQEITLGVDAGSKHIGLSASTPNKELFASEVELRNDITSLLMARKKFRRARRNRKTRYRKPRFNNRAIMKGWLAPSIKNKIQTHISVIDDVYQILPITKLIVEVGQFNTQLLKAQQENSPIPHGTDYQQGELYNWNIREYVFHRDNYTCQWCKGKSKDNILVIHHWNYWNDDHTNKPSSLITLCNTCNDSKYHKKDANRLWGWKPRITYNYKDSAFMNCMRWTLYNELKENHSNVHLTYGYITKNTRISNDLKKSHITDALCIAKNPKAKRCDEHFYQKKVRCHNRQIHKATILKGDIRKKNQSPYITKGFRLFDKVLFNNQECFIFGRRSTGYFDLRTLDGSSIHKSASYKKIRLLESNKKILTERRKSEVVQ